MQGHYFCDFELADFVRAAAITIKRNYSLLVNLEACFDIFVG